MVAGAAKSAELTDDEWLKMLRDIGERDGYFSSLGRDHSAVFVEESHDVLFVGFETLFGIRSVSDTGMPVAFDVCERRGWSHLTLITAKQDWFRDRRMFSYFDRLVDNAFFEEFDRVVFYGAGMCGYAAGAFSVTAPGASVIMVAPQATLDRDRTVWDDRFPSTRRLDFTNRYGYAPDMLEAAERGVVIYDPDEVDDAMHASLFHGPNISRFKYRRGRSGAIESDLRAMGLVSQLAEAAVEDRLDDAGLARLMTARKRHVPYLRALLARVLAEDRPALTKWLCEAVLAEQSIPRFKHHLELAQKALAQAEDMLDDEEIDGEGTISTEARDA